MNGCELIGSHYHHLVVVVVVCFLLPSGDDDRSMGQGDFLSYIHHDMTKRGERGGKGKWLS